MSEPVALRIADREYTVACEPHERDSLLDAARMLDSRMRDIRSANRMAGIDRIAVLAALNLAHELMQARCGEDDQQRDIALTLDTLSRKLDRLLAIVGR
ncbi:cell division protein ZapA [Xanthomonadaceae bacterium XH05]|nr:cell division protein ZapA [Xanthomonadaceae bacterium XH05]